MKLEATWLAPALLLAALPFARGGLFTAAPQEPADVAATPGGTYEVDPIRSSVLFKVRHADVSWFYGTFEDVSGAVTVGATPAESSVTVEVPVASLRTRDAERDEHLLGPDFLVAREFPTVRFASTAVEELRPDLWRVAGTLELRGRSRPLEIEVARTGQGSTWLADFRAGFETRFTIGAEDFGLGYATKMDASMLGREIELIVALECVRR